jgi:cupin superfamily acireductone dioxygenase involved in methionine salvage
MNVTTGNAITDGKEFRYWFVGAVETWCRENNLPFDAERYGLRSTDDIEIKWGVYKKGEVRPEWASSSDMTGMSILIRGDCIFTFREKAGEGRRREVRMTKEGDYVIWREDVEHTWEMHEDSVFLTLRWKNR